MTIQDESIPLFLDAPATPRARLHVPPEPWFYGATDRLARVLLAACVLLGAAALAVGFYGARSILDARENPPPGNLVVVVLVAVGPFVLTVLSMLSTIIVALLMRLAVDVARNVRSLRHAA